MDTDFNLTRYMTGVIGRLIKSVAKASFGDPRGFFFWARFGLHARRAGARRKKQEAGGHHIPPFLIASVTTRCNLHCAGCYARETHICGEGLGAGALPAARWRAIFHEAQQLGVSFILLGGGEPLMRPEILDLAAAHKKILFPVFTNGTLVDDRFLALFHAHRNLVPILSLEGGRDQTDTRRGKGTYDKLQAAMEGFRRRRILFGASVTVTTDNLDTITRADFLAGMRQKGCGVLIFVEYVPAEQGTEDLALAGSARMEFDRKLRSLRRGHKSMIVLTFPGDEKEMGGCLAAGRGFFHISPSGDAEPCPFSPHSDTSLRDHSLLDCLQSPLFRRLRSSELLEMSYTGGCALFGKDDTVAGLTGPFSPPHDARLSQVV